MSFKPLKIICSILFIILIALGSLFLSNVDKDWWYALITACLVAIAFFSSLFFGDSHNLYRRAAQWIVTQLFSTKTRSNITLVFLTIIVLFMIFQVWLTWPKYYLEIQVYRKSALPSNYAIQTLVIIHALADGSTREARVENNGFAQFTDLPIPTTISLQLNEKRQGKEWTWGPKAVFINKLPYPVLSYDLAEVPEDAWVAIPNASFPNSLTSFDTANQSKGRQIGDRSLQRTNAPWGIPDADLIINRYTYILGLDTIKRIPRWVAYSIAPSNIKLERRLSFIIDPAIPVNMQPDIDDFRNSGYDRGHLVSLIDVQFKGQVAAAEANYLSTLTPQLPQLNRGVWYHLENATRELANQVGLVYIIAGPIYNIKDPQKTIGDNAIPVPSHFFRVICWTSSDGQLHSAAYLVPQDVNLNLSFHEFAVSISDIEQQSGLLLMPDLDPTIANKLKNNKQQLP